MCTNIYIKTLDFLIYYLAIWYCNLHLVLASNGLEATPPRNILLLSTK